MNKRKPMSETALRQINMLQLIPREPRRISTQELMTSLDAAGFKKVTLRTVQRDLNALSIYYPVVSDEREKPFGWSWKKDAPAFGLPALDPQTALTLKLAQNYLKLELPTATLDYLSPYFNAADNMLAEMGGKLAAWPDKVRVLPRGQPLLPPRIDLEVQRIVYQALMENRRAEVVYRKPAEVKDQIFEISPLGLVVRNQVVYIVCAIGETANTPYQLLLHRMQKAQLVDKPARQMEGFSLDEYVQKGGFGLPTGRKVRLEAIFTHLAGRHLLETPLNEDQESEILPDGLIRITATVMETEELQMWLRSFGDGVVDISMEAVAG
jgi:predicted DNA-binding transcriptional regulator YafY